MVEAASGPLEGAGAEKSGGDVGLSIEELAARLEEAKARAAQTVSGAIDEKTGKRESLIGEYQSGAKKLDAAEKILAQYERQASEGTLPAEAMADLDQMRALVAEMRTSVGTVEGQIGELSSDEGVADRLREEADSEHRERILAEVKARVIRKIESHVYSGVNSWRRESYPQRVHGNMIKMSNDAGHRTERRGTPEKFSNYQDEGTLFSIEDRRAVDKTDEGAVIEMTETTVREWLEDRIATLQTQIDSAQPKQEDGFGWRRDKKLAEAGELQDEQRVLKEILTSLHEYVTADLATFLLHRQQIEQSSAIQRAERWKRNYDKLIEASRALKDIETTLPEITLPDVTISVKRNGWDTVVHVESETLYKTKLNAANALDADLKKAEAEVGSMERSGKLKGLFSGGAKKEYQGLRERRDDLKQRSTAASTEYTDLGRKLDRLQELFKPLLLSAGGTGMFENEYNGDVRTVLETIKEHLARLRRDGMPPELSGPLEEQTGLWKKVVAGQTAVRDALER